jgi:S-formylglutathione hydrolase FrmB
MKTLVTLLLLIAPSAVSFAQVTFRVHVDTSIHKTFFGRMYVYTTTDTARGVPDQVNYKQPLFAVNISNFNSNTIVEVDDSAEAYSVKPSQLKPGYYKAAAVIDADPDTRGTYNPGNAYSRTDALFKVEENKKLTVDITIDRMIGERAFKESDTLKLLNLRSDLLSSFHRKNIYVKAAVILPKEYNENPTAVYPVVYVIPGWGGTHYDAMGQNPRRRYGFDKGRPKIFVYLNPETQTRWGLHSFVDSRVNGPWGKAMVEEVIPYIRKNYRATKDTNKTFIIGQSSGGYPSLWLLFNYPKSFGGGWAVAPDPVDFSQFMGIDIYAKNANAYVDAQGNERGFFITNGKAETTMREATKQEAFEIDGGQQQAFEAEFGKLDPKTGKPKLLFDRKTGSINREVAAEWKMYDMGLLIEKHWKKYEKDLNGKIHVFAGSDDNFLLNKAVEAFKLKVEKIKANATVEIIPGANHFNVWNAPGFIERMHKEMDEKLNR